MKEQGGMRSVSIPGSDIRIDTEGSWYYRETKMVRQEIIDLFYRNLCQDASGRYFIEIGGQRCRVEVEDTAHIIWALRWGKAGDAEDSALLFLSDGSAEMFDPGTLRIGANHIPYCRIKGGLFEARFSRPAYYELAERLQHDPTDGSYFIRMRDRKYVLC